MDNKNIAERLLKLASELVAKPKQPPVIDPKKKVTLKTINEDVDPPKWKTVGKVNADAKAVLDFVKKKKLDGIWVFMDGKKEYYTVKELNSKKKVFFASVKTAGVAETILQQMGGSGRIRAMTGAHSFATSGNDVSFLFPNRKRSRGNSVKITLTPDDLYDIEFFNVSIKGSKKVKSFEGLFFDQLIETFEKQTGLYLKL